MSLHPPSSINPPRRILVRGVNWLGDAVMTAPALMRLRERFPGAHIALLTPEKLRALWLHHPAVNETIAFTANDGLFSVGRRLRSGSFDLAIVLPNSPRSAMESWLARIPRRIGHARPWRNWFLTEAILSRPEAVMMRKPSVAEIHRRNAAPTGHAPRTTYHAGAHQIHEYLHLAAAVGAAPEPLAPNLVVTPDEMEAARRKFGFEPAQLLFGLNPGAEYGPAKRWPVERFIAAAREIQQRTNCLWLILGGKGDVELANRVTTGITDHGLRITHHNLAGQTSLRELMVLLKLCRVLLTNDTGPMHAAAALGTPVVVPFGSTSPELTGPGLPGDPRHRLLKSNVPCSPCFLRECPIDFRCMNGIGIERVVEAVVELTLNR
jgi:ADP-heptose:LPS heptosyltransferase